MQIDVNAVETQRLLHDSQDSLILGRAQILARRRNDGLSAFHGDKPGTFGDFHLAIQQCRFGLLLGKAFDQPLQHLHFRHHLGHALFPGASDLLQRLPDLQSLGLGVQQIFGDLAGLPTHHVEFFSVAAITLALGERVMRKRTAKPHQPGQERRDGGGNRRHILRDEQRKRERKDRIGGGDYGVQDQWHGSEREIASSSLAIWLAKIEVYV